MHAHLQRATVAACSALLLLAFAPQVDARSRGGSFRHSPVRFHSHSHVRVFSGAGVRIGVGGLWFGGAPVIVGASAPVTYVERGDESPVTGPSWYFCESAWKYYPEVDRCAEPWIAVAPLDR